MAARRINLLPKEAGEKALNTKSVVLFRKLAYGVIGLFISANLLAGVYLLYLSNRLETSKSTQARLTQSITALEETEQKLILTKDRISKVVEILNQRAVEETFDLHTKLANNLPETITLQKSEVSISESIFEISAVNSRDLLGFSSSMISSPDYRAIVLDDMTFDPFNGYSLTFQLY